MSAAYSVHVTDAYDPIPLHDDRGKLIYSLDQAIDIAMDHYSNVWRYVFNGSISFNNLDFTYCYPIIETISTL